MKNYILAITCENGEKTNIFVTNGKNLHIQSEYINNIVDAADVDQLKTFVINDITYYIININIPFPIKHVENILYSSIAYNGINPIYLLKLFNFLMVSIEHILLLCSMCRKELQSIQDNVTLRNLVNDMCVDQTTKHLFELILVSTGTIFDESTMAFSKFNESKFPTTSFVPRIKYIHEKSGYYDNYFIFGAKDIYASTLDVYARTVNNIIDCYPHELQLDDKKMSHNLVFEDKLHSNTTRHVTYFKNEFGACITERKTSAISSTEITKPFFLVTTNSRVIVITEYTIHNKNDKSHQFLIPIVFTEHATYSLSLWIKTSQ